MLEQAGVGRGRATKQLPLPQSVVSQRRRVTWEPTQDPVWMFLSIADSANGFHAWKRPKRRGNQLPSFDLKGVPLPYPRTPRVQVKFASERIGIFHEIDCDHYIIRYEYLRYFSHEKIHTLNTPPPNTHTNCFYENQLINANSSRHISTKLLFHLIVGEFSITKLSLAGFSFSHYLYIFFSFTNSEVGMRYYLLFVRLKFLFHLKCFLILAAPRNLGETSLKADKI